MGKRRQPGDFFRTGMLCFFAVVFLFPILVMLRNASATEEFIYRASWYSWPWPPRLAGNFIETFTSPKVNIWSGYRVSLLVAGIGTVLQVFIASIAGFGLARLKSRYREIVLYFILITIMIPPQVTFIPRYMTVLDMGMVNRFIGIILPAAFNAFAAFMYRQFFLEFPRSVEDSGKLDGLGYWGLWWRLAMPAARGITAALATIIFFTEWNTFLWPLIIGQTERLWTIQVIVSSFIGSRITEYHMVFIGALAAVLPVIALYLILQRTVIRGISISTISG